MDRRALRHRRTADEIVDAAEQIVLRADLEGLTVQGIAKAIGMTAGALYRYFPSRDAIVAAVQRRVIAAVAGAVAEAVAATRDEDPELARIVALAAAVVDYARVEPERYSLLSRMFAVPRPLIADAEVAEVLPMAVGALEQVRGLFAAARASGALGPGDDTLRMLALWAAVHGAIQLDKLGRFSPDIAAGPIAAAAVDGLLIGWGSAPERVAAVRKRRG